MYRNTQNLSTNILKAWPNHARIACNILKQRFFENVNKPLTNIEAKGILQHHYILGPTDIVDFSYNINVAKWFALNKWTGQKYVQKVFHKNTDRKRGLIEASRVYEVAIRLVGKCNIDRKNITRLTRGVVQRPWNEDMAKLKISIEPETHPINIAPLWSEYPKRQDGFGLLGILAQDYDSIGSVLSVK